MRLRFSMHSRKRDRLERNALFLIGLALVPAAAIALAWNARPTAQAVAVLLGFAAYLLLSRTWMIGREPRVPVVTFHSISDKPEWLVDTHFSLPTATFERMMRYLHRRGYITVSLEDVRKHLRGEAPLGPRAIALTFDDGYLDSWVAVHPILKRHGFQGTLFVPTDFVQDGDELRPNLEDVWSGKASANDLDWSGYANWGELRAMEEQGTLRLEGHTKSHSWLFTSDQVQDFYRPGNWSFFVQWNDSPERKPYWHLGKPEADARLMGTPVFPSARSHMVRCCFLPNPELCAALNGHVLASGGFVFFQRPNWDAELRKMFNGAAVPGRWETPQEALDRVHSEFAGSKLLMEERLGKPIRVLCWPGDQYDETLEAMAASHGYESSTALGGYNLVGGGERRIQRVYFPFMHRRYREEWLNYWAFVLGLRLYEGNYYCLIPFFLLSYIIRVFNSRGGQ
ncbi:MAG: polysaccharide deacetylase family protein [Desulfocurvibacter africanus]